MLEELRPLGVSDAAKRLGIDLFEVVRLAVAAGTLGERLQFDLEQVEALRAFGGVDPSWWTDVELPEDEHPLRQRVRAAVKLMLDRGHVGEAYTRMDNVWRGLPDDDQVFLQTALTVLGEEELLAVVASPVGVQVAIAADQVDTARRIADGSHDTPGLSALYQE